MDRVDKKFAVLLSKLPRAEQESILEEWMPKLLQPDRTFSGGDPWFKAWLEVARIGLQHTYAISMLKN
jgi:hypothetical protein